ncbi:hypothetical protein GALMADRAFT_138359 [Galerina marginata CBS 339.88]|uniref:Methyltransferase domain-containing protein n=1 Tax=Galerina marginata (strain CBS 339.88) TaxID=685588 RepID=A0A067T4W8_GALM3|nr:hypothetical protein GALMADRAFT_138359 [Galerina marginata CBS 339.88]
MSSPTDPGQEHINGNGIHEDAEANGSDDYDSEHLDSPSVVELNSEDFPSYFREHDGRLFHSSSSPYPLPVDTPEQERFTLIHNLLRQFFGVNCIGPVVDVLNESQGRHRWALDICTGNGKWVIDMAQEYPRVRFRGFDIVPIATRYPPRHVQFEVDDVNTRFRWSDSTFELVNARAVAMAVLEYPQVLQEVARVLRPGGLFVSYEWAPYPAFDPSLQRDLAIYAPASFRFHDAINTALLQRRGLHPIAAQIPSFLASAGVFAEISAGQHYIPIGAWSADPSLQSIGTACLEANERYASSVKPLLCDSGWTDAEAESMLTDFIREIRTMNGLVSVLYTVHARRV